MQNPLVIAKSSWLKKGKKQLLMEASSLSAPVAMTVMGRKKINLAKKMKISEYLLNAQLKSAEYLPTVSPMLQKRSMMTTDQLTSNPSKVLSKLGPGKRVKVITKVNMMIQGQGQICLLVQSRVLKQLWSSILFSSLMSSSPTGSVSTDSFSSPSERRRLSFLVSPWWMRNLSILCLQTWERQKEMFIHRSIELKMMAITKQMMMGSTASSSGPKIARIMSRMMVMKRPEPAVPTVNLETTSCERQLIMAKKESWDRLALTPITKAHNSNSTKPTVLSRRAIETTRMAMREKLMPMLPAVMSCTYLNLLLSRWKVEPVTMQPTKTGMGRKVQILKASKAAWKQSRAASTAFHPSRELMPLMRKMKTVLGVSASMS